MTLCACRRLIFDQNLETDAKQAARDAVGTVRFWFRKKYNLTPNDDRYLDMTEMAMLTEYWTHYYYETPKHEWECDTDDFEQEQAAMDAEMGIPPEDDFEDISHG